VTGKPYFLIASEEAPIEKKTIAVGKVEEAREAEVKNVVETTSMKRSAVVKHHPRSLLDS